MGSLSKSLIFAASEALARDIGSHDVSRQPHKKGTSKNAQLAAEQCFPYNQTMTTVN